MAPKRQQPSTSSAQNMTQLMGVIGDPTRIEIFRILSREKGICVSEVATELGESIANVSHHLQVMAGAGLLTPVRDGKRVCYNLSEEKLVQDVKKLFKKYF